MENYLKIEEWIDGQLLDEDSKEFEIQILSNGKMNSEYIFRNEVNLAIKDKHFAELREKLQNQFDNKSHSTSKVLPQRDFLKPGILQLLLFH
jgi:hypothetical protein